jgi:hypothetical protein
LEPDTYVIGEKLTWNEFFSIAEEVKGVISRNLRLYRCEIWKNHRTTQVPIYNFPKEQLQGFLAAFGIMFALGAFDVKPAHTINWDFPSIHAKKVKDLLTEVWKGK